jgi:branched-chain amino acid transport system permease protein
MNLGFLLEVTLGGLMAGVLYSLVALGFVLIFKASGVFNFAQGAMVLFAALAMARLSGMDSRLAGHPEPVAGQRSGLCGVGGDHDRAGDGD